MAVQSEPAIGCRVLLGGKHRATVRYVGPIDDQQGVWVGIEYDDPSRGKHDGSHGGRRYFSCSHSSTGGSFVRLPKLLEAADFGRSLAAAAAERYGAGGSQTGGGGAPRQEQLFVPTAGNRRVAVEVMAPELLARRQSGAGSPAAVLAQHAVSTIGSAAELAAMLPSLTELDLSDNLVSSWQFVAELAVALPSLRALNLSGNRLQLPSLAAPAPALPSAAAGALARLETLVLNSCAVCWEQVVAVAQQLPGLRELHLCGNGLASLRLPDTHGTGTTAAEGSSSQGASAAADSGSGGPTDADAACQLAAAFPQLELLDLENNQLSRWADVALLRMLPRLRSLLLSGNQLAEVQYSGGFTSLHTLLLGSNRLASWAAADELGRFPALREARLSDNPVAAAAPSAARYQAIARISCLTALNASTISPAERWDAEVNYLRLVTDELAAAAPAARGAVLNANPRFEALTKKYGELTPAAPKAAAGTALGSSMAQLTICHGSKSLQKKLPVSLTVGKLKLLLERLLRVKAAQQALLLVPPEDSSAQPEDITDDDSRDLRYYDAADGYRLEVSMSDPAARAAALAAAKQAAAVAHAARMEQQEKTIQQFRAVEQRLMT